MVVHRMEKISRPCSRSLQSEGILACRREAQLALVAAKLLTNGEARRARLDADSISKLGSRAERSDDGVACDGNPTCIPVTCRNLWCGGCRVGACDGKCLQEMLTALQDWSQA